MNALGMLEVYSFTTIVCAADVAAKAADVKVIAFDRTRPKSEAVPAPLVMQMKIEGDNAAVKAAIEASSEYAKKEGMYIISHVIPRPGEEMEKMAEGVMEACGKPSGSAKVLDKEDIIKIYKMAK